MPIICQLDKNYNASYSLEADRRILFMPLYAIDDYCFNRVDVKEMIKKLGLSVVYEDLAIRCTYYADWRYSAIIKFIYWLRDKFYWRFIMTEVIYKRMKLIKIDPAEQYSWRRNFKPFAEIIRLWKYGVY